jgi:hypothetical protein
VHGKRAESIDIDFKYFTKVSEKKIGVTADICKAFQRIEIEERQRFPHVSLVGELC